MTTDIEADLVCDAAAGNVVALERLLRNHYAGLLAYAQRHTPNELRREIEAQDVIQDTVFEAVRRIRELRNLDARSFQSWLYTIARNRIVELLRMHRSLKRGGGRNLHEDELNSGEGIVIRLLEDLAVYERTPSQSAVAHELIERLEIAMSQLEADQQQLLRMRYMQGLDVAEVARATNRSEGAVRMACMRSLKSLRALLVSASRAG